MHLRINGKEEVVQSRTVAELLCELNTPSNGVAVAVNGIVVARKEHASTCLKERDEIELVRAVQGG